MQYRIGCVPFANAIPYRLWFESKKLPVEIITAVPSQLASMFYHNELDVMLTSSYVSLSTAGIKVAGGVSISSFEHVASVKLFSKVIPNEIQTLVLDPASLTGNRLGQIILRECYHCYPEIVEATGNLEEKLKKADAVILIGDACLKESQDYHAPYILDLGKEWNKLTNLPFVWALWMGRDKMTPQVVEWLQESRQWSLANLEQVVQHALKKYNWDKDFAYSYYSKHLDFRLSEKHILGLKCYRDFLLKHHFLTMSFSPQIVKIT